MNFDGGVLIYLLVIFWKLPAGLHDIIFVLSLSLSHICYHLSLRNCKNDLGYRYKIFPSESHFCVMNKLGLGGEEQRIGKDSKYVLVNKYTQNICNRSEQT